jgi:hypothetical protein
MQNTFLLYIETELSVRKAYSQGKSEDVSLASAIYLVSLLVTSLYAISTSK